MSDFLDILLNAKENGITLDSCGSDERQYSWGLYTDLCGMSVEDARKAASACCGGGGGGEDPESGKTTNSVIFTLASVETGYGLTLQFSAAPTAPVIVSYSLDGAYKTVTVPAGVMIYETDDVIESKYATLTNISFVSSDQAYKYSAINNVKTGIFKITFNLDGKVYFEDNVKCETEVNVPAVPAKYAEGYDFAWKVNGTEEIVEEGFIMPEKDTVINGYPTIHTWQIHYSYNGVEKAGGDISVNYGTKLNTISIIKETGITGYSFMKWDVVDGDNSVLPETMPDNDLTIIGWYMINTRNLIFKVDGTAKSSIQYTYGAEIHPGEDEDWPKDPTKTGYTFNGWGDIPATMPDNDVILNANFEINTHTLTYKLEKESGIETSTEIYKFDEIINWKEISEEGFTFSGWDIKSEYSKMPDSDIEAKATLERNSYTYKFIVDGEVIGSGETLYQGTIVKPSDPEKEGYDFVGWDKDVPTTMPAENLTFNAVFNIRSFTITYKVDGEQWGAVETYEYGSDIAIKDEPSKVGYEFSGWDPDALPETMPAEDIEVNGSFTIRKYFLTYWTYKDGDSDPEVYKQFEYEYNSDIEPLGNPPEIEGYTFGGWIDEPTKMPPYAKSVDGYYNLNQYTLKYIVDGEDYASENHNFGEDIIPIANPEKEGYTFSGWNDVIPHTMPAHDVTLSGTFAINSYTITYIIDGVTAHTDIYEYKADVTPYVPAEQTGYKFSGWSGSKPMPSKMGAENLVFNGSYNPIPYDLKFSIEGQPTTATTKYYGDTIVAPVPEKREGYKFAWDKPVPATMPPSNLEFIGTYTEVTDSTMIYYGYNNQIKVSGMTAEEIAELQNFDYAVDPSEEAKIYFAADPKVQEYLDAEEEAETEEEAEAIDEEMEEYKYDYRYGILVAAPDGVSIKLLNSQSTPVALVSMKNINIDDTDYVLYMFNGNNNLKPTERDGIYWSCTIIVE